MCIFLLTIATTPVFSQESAYPESIPLDETGITQTLDDQEADATGTVELDGEALPNTGNSFTAPSTQSNQLPENIRRAIILQRLEAQQPSFEPYRLGPGDGIAVQVQRFSDLSFQANLDLEGNVSVPMVGTVNLTGFTSDQARQRLYTLYNNYVVDPQVSLTLTAQRPVEITFVGEIPRPGVYSLTEPDLTAALVTAGGATGMADLRKVLVRRTLPNGEVLEQTIDLFTPLHQGSSVPQVRLQDGDVVSIPALTAADMATYDRNLIAISTLAEPEITVHIMNRATGGRGTESRFGAMTLPNGSNFIDALAQAGVNPDLAAYNRIAVIRYNPATGTADTIMIDANAAIHGDAAQNIPLQDNDVLVVDRNTLARITNALNTFTQPFKDVLGFLLFFDSLAETTSELF
jgi:polysaccharide export outer membrane protein